MTAYGDSVSMLMSRTSSSGSSGVVERDARAVSIRVPRTTRHETRCTRDACAKVARGVGMASHERRETEDLGAQWLAHMRRGELESAWAVSDEVMRRRGGASHAH